MTQMTDRSADKEHAEAIKLAAISLAKTMNDAARTGLIISIEIKPHYWKGDGWRGEFMPVIDISRTIRLS